MAHTLAMHHESLDRAYERDLDAAQAFEDRAERAGCALSERLAKLDTAPQHVRDREYLELIRDIFTGSKYGRACLHSLLEKVAQDVDPRPSEMLIRWHEAQP